MAKKGQTTGGPKAKPKTDETQEKKPVGVLKDLNSLASGSLREYQSRSEREAVIQRLIILGVGAALALVVIILAAAFISDQVITPGRTVATVNGDNISVREFQQRVRFERVLSSERISAEINRLIEDEGLSFDEAGQRVVSFEPYASLWQEINVPDLMGLRVLNDMIDDAFIREEAARRGISVTQEEIDAQIQQLFNFDSQALAVLAAEITPEAEVTEEPATATPTPFVSPTPSPEPSPTATPETEPTATITPFPTVPPAPTLTVDQRQSAYERVLNDFYNTARRDANYNRDRVNAFFEAQALRDALAQVVVEPETDEVWVNSRHILVETEEEALDIIAALQTGESFVLLAQAASTDTGSGSRGGELGWAPASNFVEPFANAVREAEIGEIFGPVQSDFGFHIIQVRAREDREVNEEQVAFNREIAFEEWLNELRSAEGNESEISNIWPGFVPSDPPWRYRPR